MFDIGFPELILIAIVGLLVIGPERLPEALRTLGLWIGRMRRSFTNVKTEIEKEIGMDEIRRQLHNEAVMEEMKRIERDVRDSVRAGENPNHRSAPSRDEAPEQQAPPSLEPQAGSRGAPAAGADAPRTGSNPGDAHPDAATDTGAEPAGTGKTGSGEPQHRAGKADDARHG